MYRKLVLVKKCAKFVGGPGSIRNDNVVLFVSVLLSVFVVGSCRCLKIL